MAVGTSLGIESLKDGPNESSDQERRHSREDFKRKGAWSVVRGPAT